MPPENPLLDAMGPHRELGVWPDLLEHNPLDHFPENPTAEDRESFLDMMKDRFAVTRVAVETAFDIQRMIRSGYRERNPCDPANRKKIIEISSIEGTFATKTPVFYRDSQCKIIHGITGMGKSQMVERILGTYDQVVIHGRSDSALWLKHTQIVHLTAKMPGDGSRGGFVSAVLLALDSVLETDYFNDYCRSRMTVEARALKTAQLLALHSVGLLVIEEMQAKNFMGSKYRSELQLFFLGLLSFGVPLLLVGNPLAFKDIGMYRQTQRRFLSCEPAELWPYDSWKSPDWCDAIAPAIWTYRVVDQYQEYTRKVGKTLWHCSGGIPGYARKLVSEMQKSMLLRRPGSNHSIESMEKHFKTLASFAQFRPLINGLVKRNLDEVVTDEDMPIKELKLRWELANPSTKTKRQSTPNAGPAAKNKNATDWESYSKKTVRDQKAAKSRAKNKEKRNQETADQLEAGDLRTPAQHADKLLHGLRKLHDE
ncbi:MAG: ATP-binding protein [Desulfofustis sp.]|nr:ATP-binding protein [Desulfofustis sp.]